MIRVKDLPPNGGTHESGPVFLHCAHCGGEFSATRGDYFMADPDTVMMHCGHPMQLVTKHVTLKEVKA